MKSRGTLVCAAALLVGCGGTSDLELTYISGHLGDYRSCLDQAADAKKAAEAPPANLTDREKGCSFCECYSDHPTCKDPKVPTQCIVPMITFNVTNRAGTSVAIPSVASLRLLLDGAEPAPLQLLKVVIGDASIKELASGAVLLMQTSFQGPSSVDQKRRPRIELILDSLDAEPAGMTTPELRPFGL
jgi:hypothetical protein